jgi:putative ABC transport system permease protein
MELWIGALSLGLLYAFMTMGVFITFRIHDFPTLPWTEVLPPGAAIMAVLIVMGINPFLALGLPLSLELAAAPPL